MLTPEIASLPNGGTKELGGPMNQGWVGRAVFMTQEGGGVVGC